MSNRVMVLLCLVIAACSTHASLLRVDDAQATRIGADSRERLKNTDEREIAKARDEEARAAVELARARDLVHNVTAERARTQDPQIIRVLDVKEAWSSAQLHWRELQVECARRHELAATATEELDKAEMVSRNGGELDVERFRGQHAQAHQEWSQCTARLATAHAVVDAAEGQLAVAKNQYAHDKLGSQAVATSTRSASGHSR